MIRCAMRNSPGQQLRACLLAGVFFTATTQAIGDDTPPVQAGLSIGLAATDNVSFSATDPESDQFAYIGPHVEYAQQMGSHTLKARAVGFVTWHAEYQNEEVRDWLLGADWKHEINDSFDVRLAASMADETIDRLVPGQGEGLDRTEVRNRVLAGGATRRFGEWSLSLDASQRFMDYEDVRAVGGVINKGDEDRYENAFILGFARSTQAGAFTPSLTLIGKRIDYRQRVDDNGDQRSSDVIIIQPGIAFSGVGGLTGNLAVGGYYRDFEDDGFDTIRSWVANGYLARPLGESNKASLAVFRAFNEFNQTGTPGYFATGATLNFDHTLSDQTGLTGALSWIEYEFVDAGGDFRDLIFGASYQRTLSKNISLQIKYTHTDRGSDSSLFGDFDENRLYLVFHFGAGENPLAAREWFYWVGQNTTPN